MIGDIISGLVGGGVLGQIVTLLLPATTAAAQSGELSVQGIISQVVTGGAGGASAARLAAIPAGESPANRGVQTLL
jgi:hypothetical protein